MRPFHVAIIGAGLGGLCLAQALKRAGIGFDVYERDATPLSRGQGYRIRIDANGQDALARCLPPALFTLFRDSCAVAANGGRFLDCRLRPSAGRPAPSWEKARAEGADEPGDLSANRQTLREILLCGLEGQVHFGKAFERYEIDAENGVVIRFEDGGSVRCDLLVGADGVNSPVRRQFLPQAEPADTGSVCVYGKAAASAAMRERVGAELCSATSVIFADGYAAIIDAMLFRQALPALADRLAPGCRLSAVEDYLYWALIGPRASLGMDRVSMTAGAALHEHIGKLVEDWDPRLRALFRHSGADTLALLPVRSAADVPAWPSGGVTLLGDAIHVMSPAGGVGANTALRDAAVLAATLTEAASSGTPPRQALPRYEADLRERAAAALHASAQGAQRLFSPAARAA